MQRWTLTLMLALTPSMAQALDLLVPDAFASVGAALDAAQPGDTIVVAAGTFPLTTTRTGLDVTIRGAGMEDTILSGGGGDGVILMVTSSNLTLQDLTLFDGDKGVQAEQTFLRLERVRVDRCGDGIDLEGGASMIATDSEFVWNGDDGIDLDRDSSLLCVRCLITDSDDDGIEIRTHDFTGPPVTIEIASSWILRNGEAGIQLIDDEDPTDRSVHIHDTVVADNGRGGVTWQCCGNTDEVLDGHPGDEPVLIERSTIVGNAGPGVEGGAVGLMQVRESILWGNAFDLYQVGGPLGTNLVGVDPLFTTDYRLSFASPARGAGETGGDLGAFPWRECSDGADNDGDGAVDLADPQCASLDGARERPPQRCGLGPEAAAALAALFWLRRRAGRRAYSSAW